MSLISYVLNADSGHTSMHYLATRQGMTHPGVLANAEDSRTELKAIQAERSFTVPCILQLSIQRLFCTELHNTIIIIIIIINRFV